MAFYYQTIFHNQTDKEFFVSLLDYAELHNRLIVNPNDLHFDTAELLLEAAKRLKNDR